MKINLQAFRMVFLFVTLAGFSSAAKAQKDTIPPVITQYCGDTLKVQIGSVWVEQWPRVTDNQSDSAHIIITRTWGNNGAVSFVRGIYSSTIEAADSNGNKAKCTYYYKVDDFIPPIIELNTSDTVCHKVRTPYNTKQVSVIDNFYPGNQVSVTLASSNVNANVPGLYKEVFEAIDPSGNITFKTRFVLVSENCNTSGVNVIFHDWLLVSPNPANVEFMVTPLVAVHNNYLRILAADGKVVLEASVNQQMTIDSRSFASGIYSLQLFSGETLSVQKLVICH